MLVVTVVAFLITALHIWKGLNLYIDWLSAGWKIPKTSLINYSFKWYFTHMTVTVFNIYILNITINIGVARYE